MADENLRSKHAFGNLENVDAALKDGKIDNFDVLFLKDKNDKPTIGWIDKDGNKVILEDRVGVSEDIVDTKVKAAISEANAYSDSKIEKSLDAYSKEKYEIKSLPVGAIVDYRDKEIRVLCPEGTVWEKQNVGATGNANMYYMSFYAYAPDNAVSFKEGDRGVIIDEMHTFDEDFSGVDSIGRKYSVCWLALASYDETNGWTYFGKNSSESKYIGWDYVVEWYNADGVVIASDCVRINLSNEACHSSLIPSYVSALSAELDKKLAEVANGFEIVEF